MAQIIILNRRNLLKENFIVHLYLNIVKENLLNG